MLRSVGHARILFFFFDGGGGHINVHVNLSNMLYLVAYLITLKLVLCFQCRQILSRLVNSHFLICINAALHHFPASVC